MGLIKDTLETVVSSFPLFGQLKSLLPTSNPTLVTIGTVKTKALEAAIRAEKKWLWQRLGQPDVDTFLEWVQRGRTYCRQCKGSVTPWLEQGIELGVECPPCRKQATEAEVQQLASEVQRQV